MKNSTLKLDNLSERLVHLLEITQTRKADLARAINVKPQVIHFLCKSKTKSSRFTFEIASILGVNTRWLATGEGVMFVADDPSHQILEEYKKIPVLDVENIIAAYKSNSLESIQAKSWLARKTRHGNMFAMNVPDDAMVPIIPYNATAFIQFEKNYTAKEGNVLLVFLKQFNALIIRQFSTIKKNHYLIPQNVENYEKMPFSRDTQIVGLVTDYHYAL